MKAIVCVKQVPDTSGKVAVNPDGTLNRASMPTISNPDDMNALEAALALKDATGCKVVVVSMGPPPAEGMLHEMLAMGADEAFLISGREFGGSDTFATSQIIAAGIQAIGLDDDDVVFCGRQAIDGDTAQVGPQIAEKLGIPQISYVQEVQELGDGKIRAKRAIEGGYEVLEAPLPALLTVVDANQPRPQNASRIIKYKKAKTPSEIAAAKGAPATDEDIAALSAKGLLIQEWNAAYCVPQDEFNRLGKAGSPTNVKHILSVVLTAGNFQEVAPTPEAVGNLVHELIEDHTLG